jgi:hypothetical protein
LGDPFGLYFSSLLSIAANLGREATFVIRSAIGRNRNTIDLPFGNIYYGIGFKPPDEFAIPASTELE